MSCLSFLELIIISNGIKILNTHIRWLEQYKVNLTATVKELATSEIMWLKILRIQKILPPIQKIIASLIFRFEQTTARPSFPDLVQPNTIQFFLFYWLMQHNNIKTTEGNPNTTSYTNFFGLPSNDIIATAATMLITNSPQAVADVIEKLNSPELNWDLTNQQMGRYLTSIINDLDLLELGLSICFLLFK